jgi:hypothetical protein
MSLQHHDARHANRAPSLPLVSPSAVIGGTTIGLALAIIAGGLWSSLAISSGDSTFYNHLPWWFGATLIGAALVGSLLSGLLSSNRGAAAGMINGLSTSGLLIAVGAALALGAVATNNATAAVVVHNTTLHVQLIRPYVALIAAAVAFGAALVGGVVGGLLPRRTVSPAITSGAIDEPAPERRVSVGSQAA